MLWYYVLSETFFWALEKVIKTNGHVLYSFCFGLMENAELYAETISTHDSPWKLVLALLTAQRFKSIILVDLKLKNFMLSMGSEVFILLLYQIITTPERLEFPIWRPKVEWRHNMPLHRHEWLDKLSSHFTLMVSSFISTVIPPYDSMFDTSCFRLIFHHPVLPCS